jgi:phage shock protein PspC (stress-responsive transcriptional regulator)
MDHPVVESGRRPIGEWHRHFEERKIAGVCAGVAHQLDVPLTVVRATFILLALLPGFSAAGVFLYLILWFLMPEEPGAHSGLDRIVQVVNTLTGDRADETEPRERER